MRAVIIFLLLLFALDASSQQIKGKITDKQTGKPLSNVRVELTRYPTGKPPVLCASAYSDPQGNYIISYKRDTISADSVFSIKANAGNYRTADGKWYYTVPRPFRFMDGADNKVDFKLKPRGVPQAIPEIYFKENGIDDEKHFNGHDTVSSSFCAQMVADILHQKAMFVVEVRGFAEEAEIDPGKLSLARAEKLRKMLEELDVDMDRVTVKGYGSGLPPTQESVIGFIKENSHGERTYYIMNKRAELVLSVDSTRIPVVFKLEGVVTDCQNKVSVENVTVSILGSDGYAQEVKTDKAGYYSASLTGGISYVISTDAKTAMKTVYVERYLNSTEKGKITTVDEKESKIFRKDFCLTPATCGWARFPALLFDYNSLGYSTTLRDEWYGSGDSALYWLVQTLKDNPTIVIEISAHGDGREPFRITEQRAEKVVDALVKMGVDKDRLVPKAYGNKKRLIKDEEIAKLTTKEEKEAAHAKNRRVVFKVLRWDYNASANAIPPVIDLKISGDKKNALNGD
jgi:outer membrane protein OmpA-like peptidoglycan-associated protein